MAPFTVRSELDEVFGDIEIGLSLFPKGSGVSFTLTYTGQIASDTDFHAASFNIAVPF